MGTTSYNTVMVIDDNDIDLFINKRVIEFSKFGENILTMQSAKDALQYLNSGKELPEVIFLDLNMPIMDGYGFLYEFEKFPEEIKTQISIFVLTSSDNDRDREKTAANPRVSKFVSKPLDDEKLTEIEEYMQHAKVGAQ
ncbi:MAG: response regulator [Fulvivirga sp.]|nr:response regulator [Fulvivirga sp.]